MLTNQEFFNTVSETYDNMIKFHDAVKSKIEYLRNFSSADTNIAADLGCGTGVDSIALSKLGFKVTAFDISEGMINKAKQNALAENVSVDFINQSITDISDLHFNKYDLIISLGNSLANLDLAQLKVSINNIKKMLFINGRVFIQILNYSNVLKNKDRIINITQNKDFNFIRFYDFMDGWLQFNILQYSIQNPKDYKLISTKIYPHTSSELLNILKNSGFSKVSLFGDLNNSEFNEDSSKDLVILAEN